MRDYRLFCLLLVICGGLAVTYAAQKTPAQRQAMGGPQIRSAEQNKVPVRQLFEEMFSRGRYDLEGQVFARNCTVHFGNRTVPLDEAVAEGKGWRSAAPDLVMKINQLTVNGDTVTAAWTAKGTHTGQGHGLKPTGKHILMHGTSTFRIANGKIVEAVNEEYRPELFRQLGVSRTQAFMFFAGERILAALDPIIPDRLYASLF